MVPFSLKVILLDVEGGSYIGPILMDVIMELVRVQCMAQRPLGVLIG